jgi:hypothetical protein
MGDAILALTTLMGKRGVEYMFYEDDGDRDWWGLYLLLHRN